MALSIDIKVDDHGVPQKLRSMDGEVGQRTQHLLNDISFTVQSAIKRSSPHKTGRMKSSIRKTVNPNSALVFADEGIAPYVNYVIEGRGAFCAKGSTQGTYMGITRSGSLGTSKKGKRGGYLHFWINGKEIFTRCVRASRPNDVFLKGYNKSKGQVTNKINKFGDWITQL